MVWRHPQQPPDPKIYHSQAKVGFDNFPYSRTIYWPFVKEDGSAGVQARIELWPGAHVIALDHDSGGVYVVRRERETDRGKISVIELPNGGIDPGATAKDTAAAELLEEVGAEALAPDDWVQLTPDHGMQPLDGLVITRQYAFLCLRVRIVQPFETDETQELLCLPFSALFSLADQGEFNDPMTLCFLVMAYRWLKQNRPGLLAKSNSLNSL